MDPPLFEWCRRTHQLQLLNYDQIEPSFVVVIRIEYQKWMVHLANICCLHQKVVFLIERDGFLILIDSYTNIYWVQCIFLL